MGYQNNRSCFYKQCCLVMALFLLLPQVLHSQTLEELNQQIKNKENEIIEIKKKAAIYQKNLRVKQNEVVSLKNQLAVFDNSIAKLQLDISATNSAIAKNKLETRNTELQILVLADEIEAKRTTLAELLQKIYQTDSQNQIKIFLSHDSLSDFFNEVEYTKDIQNNVKENLRLLKDEKKELLNRQAELNEKQIKLTALLEELEFEKTELTGQINYKNTLLAQTKNSEQKFATLFAQAKKEEAAIDAEIVTLEKEARAKLNQLKKDQPQLTASTLSWPIPPNTITAYFHDPDYPFRYIFEHPAIDVRAKHGTPITTPADGYVLKVKDGGMGYSYFALIHANGISTVYGHVSKIFVQEDAFVAKGEIVGLTGGTPGTPGAGRLTTGPHLHFEVRLNGIPVNPLDYLP